MSEERDALAKKLESALKSQGKTLDALADSTKIPQSTLRALMNEEISAVLPERVYMRGHLGVVSRELGLDPDEMGNLFDAAYPRPTEGYSPVTPRISHSSMAVMAGLGGVALLAVVLAFARVIG